MLLGSNDELVDRAEHRQAACAVAPLGLLPAGGAHAQSVSRPANDIVLSIGRGQLVTIPGRMSDVFVANDKIADVQVRTANQLYIFGKSGGETTVYASNAAGQTVWSANVRVGSNIDSIDQMLGLAMPEANVSVATMSTLYFFADSRKPAVPSSDAALLSCRTATISTVR